MFRMILDDLLNAILPSRRRRCALAQKRFEIHRTIHRRQAEKVRQQKFIMRLPVWDMSTEEVERLPRDSTKEFLMTCPLGTWILCKPNPCMPHVQIVGQVVDGMQLSVEEHGAILLSAPKRGINHYRLHITEFWKKESREAVEV